MVGIPDAVSLNRGRAYFSTKTRQLFQAAYAGDFYLPDGEKIYPVEEIVEISPDGKRAIIQAAAADGGSSFQHPTEANVIANYILETAKKKLRLPELPAIWPDPLSEHIELPSLLENRIAGGWDSKKWHKTKQWKSSKEQRDIISPFLGLYDMPSKQKQFLYQMNPEQCGDHLLIFGSAGTGKSLQIRTLITSSALTNPPDKVNFYILDYGGQSTLSVLSEFPHVGSVATRLEKEKAERIIQFFHNELKVRNQVLQRAKEDNWLDYNNSNQRKLPAMYLVIDNFKSFRNSMDDEIAKSISSLVSGGAASGIFLIISSVSPRDLTQGLFDNILTRISFSQADQSEYSNVVGRPTEAKIEEELALGVIPGRGYLKGNPPIEFQAALPVLGDGDSIQLANLRKLTESMDNAWKGTRPQDIEKMPLHIYTDYTEKGLVHDPYWIPLGKEYTTLEPIGLSIVDDGPFFIISGVSGLTGKTSLLKMWLLSLAHKFPPEQMHFFIIDFHSHSMVRFKDLPQTKYYIPIRPALESALSDLTKVIDEREAKIEKAYKKDAATDIQKLTSQWPHIVVVIDDYPRFASKAGDMTARLATMIDNGDELKILSIIVGNVNEFPSSFNDPIMKQNSQHGCGILFGGNEKIDLFNDAKKPSSHPFMVGLPSGRGYVINRGKVDFFHSFSYWQKDEIEQQSLDKWISKINEIHKK